MSLSFPNPAVSHSLGVFLDRIAPEKATRPRIITTRENQESVGERRTVEHTVGGNVTILEGRNLLLRCPVEGVPTPSTRWLFDGSPVQVSDTLQIDDDTGDLTIIEMTQDDVGEYSCIATNIAGETVEVSYTTVIGEFILMQVLLYHFSGASRPKHPWHKSISLDKLS